MAGDGRSHMALSAQRHPQIDMSQHRRRRQQCRSGKALTGLLDLPLCPCHGAIGQRLVRRDRLIFQAHRIPPAHEAALLPS
jgi:hypothetical protein